MKRTIAAIVLLASLGVLLKLGMKRGAERRVDAEAPAVAATIPDPAQADRRALREEYPDHAELIDRVFDRYGSNAVAIERTDGLRGLRLLDRFDLEAIFLYEHYPEEFRRLAGLISDEAAAEVLIGWREFFGLKRSDAADRKVLLTEIGRLNRRERRAAAEYPAALPLILTDPPGVTDLIERLDRDPEQLGQALAVLMSIDLEPGAADLAAATRTIDHYGDLALDAFRLQGLEGFATVHLFGPLLLAIGDAIPLDQALIVARVNEEYLSRRLRSRSPEAVALEVRHAGAAGLIPEVGGSPYGLRLIAEHGAMGEAALRRSGPDAATIAFESYEPPLRERAVEATAEYGPAALAMLAKYAENPGFREILGRYGPAVIPPIAKADAAPELLAALRAKQDRSTLENVAFAMASMSKESGQQAIALIRDDGIARAEALGDSETAYYEFLPLYDVLHLGNILRQGYAPTRGELSWALIDAGFIVMDAASLVALQPEGAAASELARSQVKAAAREGAERLGREVAEEATEAATRLAARRAGAEVAEATTERAARWWAVRTAGGLFRALQSYPEALSKLSVKQATDLARPIAAKAGLRLTSWSPVRFVKDGAVVLRSIPADRGLKYLALEATQAGVGVFAIHKMEEHLASRRPDDRLTAGRR